MLEKQLTLADGTKYVQPLGLFINNEFVCSQSGATITTVDPTTEKPIADVYAAEEADVDVAVAAARKAYVEVWRDMPGKEKARLLRNLAHQYEENRELLAAIDAADAGKPKVSNAMNDVQESIDLFYYYAGWADKKQGHTIETNVDKFAYTLHEPLGVCGQIIPWNYPLGMAGWKIGPALAAGNVIVMKVSEVTPLSMLFVGTLVQKAGFPPGVINIITGLGARAGAALASHMDVDKIAFTGSTATGRTVLKAASSNLKNVTLECGGKSPNLVFEDADFDQAVKWALFGIMYNMGQNCSATSRVYVQESVYDKFVAALKTEVEAYTRKLGSPFEDSAEHGPQVSEVQMKRILGYIEAGKTEGARLVVGGRRVDRAGYYIEPTVFADVNEDMTIVKEEIFGPVVTVSSFKDEADAVAKANNSSYGLGSAVFTENIGKALRVASRIDAGTVWINSNNDTEINVPFGGFKTSGIGSELGEYALKVYTRTKAVHVNLGNRL